MTQHKSACATVNHVPRWESHGSERRLHLTGALGAALADRVLELGWIERRPKGRAVTVTPEGRAGSVEQFRVELSVGSRRDDR